MEALAKLEATFKAVTAAREKHGKPFQRAAEFWKHIPPVFPVMRVIAATLLRDTLDVHSGKEMPVLKMSRSTISIEKLGENAKIIFVSHRWWSSIKHLPDFELRKMRLMINRIIPEIALHFDIAFEDIYVWIDFVCIDQQNTAPGVQALPFYVAAADCVLALRAGDEHFAADPQVYFDKKSGTIQSYEGDRDLHPGHYNNRVWTALELFAATSAWVASVRGTGDAIFEVELSPTLEIVWGPVESFRSMQKAFHNVASWTLPPRKNLDVEADLTVLEPVMLALATGGGLPRFLAAAKFGFTSAMSMFIAAKDNVNETVTQLTDGSYANLDGCTALHLSAAQQNERAIAILVNAKSIDVNARDAKGRTPLHCLTGVGWLASTGAVDTQVILRSAHRLLQARALPNVQDSFGQTPLFLAEELCGDKSLVQMLRDAHQLYELHPRCCFGFSSRARRTPVQTDTHKIFDGPRGPSPQVYTKTTKSGQVWMYREYPNDKPSGTLFAVHSSFFDKGVFSKFAAILARSVPLRIICVDLPGCGGSGAPSRDLNYSFICNELAELIVSSDWGPVHYVGLSVGCDFGLRLAAAWPTLIRSLTLMAFASACLPVPPLRKGIEGFIAAVRAEDGREFLLNYMKTPGMLGRAYLQAPQCQASREQLWAKVARMDLAHATKVPEMWIKRDWVPDFDSVRCPTLILAGSLDEQFLACASEAKQKMPAATIAFIRRIGHQIPLEAPEKSAQLFMDFLIDSFAAGMGVRTVDSNSLISQACLLGKVGKTYSDGMTVRKCTTL